MGLVEFSCGASSTRCKSRPTSPREIMCSLTDGTVSKHRRFGVDVLTFALCQEFWQCDGQKFCTERVAPHCSAHIRWDAVSLRRARARAKIFVPQLLCPLSV